MPAALDGLSPAQRSAAVHAGGPLLIVGGAGSGKTRTLVARFAWLVEQGEAPEAILALARSERAADALRRQVEEEIAGPYEALAVTTVHDLCARLLREHALAAGVDPFAVAVGRADRLAMLLERIDELTIRSHDFRGNPAALIASFVRRIDRLKDELISAEDYAAWAAGLDADADDAARARAAQECEFAEIYRAHDRMLAEAGALDGGDLVIRALALLRDHPHVRAQVAERYRHCSWTTCRSRTSRTACCCGCWPPSTATSPPRATTTRRSTASAPRRRRTCATSRRSCRTRRS